jgi:hypothetical protein
MMQVPTSTHDGRVSSAAFVEDHRDVASTTPRLPSPFDERPALTTKEFAHILRMTGNDGKPTDAAHALMKEHGFPVNRRGDRRITWEAVDRIRGAAA